MTNGPGGTEVGRVYIRVLPDTSEFAAKIKAAVKGMQDKVEVGVNVNTAQAKAQLKELTRTSEVKLIANADTTKAQASIDRLAHDKQIVIQAEASTEKAAAKLEALTERRRNLNIRVSAVTAQAAAQLAALDRTRDVTIRAKLNDASIAKAQARIAALERRRQLVMSLDTKQVTKRYNRLKQQMRHLQSQLQIQTDPKSLRKIRKQLRDTTRGFQLLGDVRLRGKDAVDQTLANLQKRHQVVIDARTKKFDKAIAKIDAEIQAVRDKRNVTLTALFDGVKAKGEWEAWKASMESQSEKIRVALDTAKATADWAEYKALVEHYRVQINADLNTARAATDAVALKNEIEKMRVKLKATLDDDLVKARLAILSRDYTIDLKTAINDAGAKVKLDNLAKDRKVYFDAILETKKAIAQFNALDRDRIAEVHVRLKDALKAQAEMAALGKSRTAEFKAEVKKANRAEAELEFLSRDRTVHIKVKKSWRSGIIGGLTREFGVASRGAGLLSGALTSLGGIAARVFQGVAGSAIAGLGKLTSYFGDAGDGMLQLGKQMATSSVQGLMSVVSSGVAAVAALALLAAIAGVCIAMFAGLLASILAVVGAILGMVLAVAMLAAVLVGAALGAVALLAVPVAFIAGAGLMLAKSKELNKEFNKLSQTFKDVMKKAARPMIKEFQKELPKLRQWLWDMEDDFAGAFKAASKHLKDFRLAVQNFVEGILPGLTKGMDSEGFSKFTDGFKTAMGDLGKAIGDSFAILADNGGKFAGVVKEIGRGFGQVLPSLARFMSALATNAPATGKFADGVARMFDQLSATFTRALSSDGWGKTVDGIGNMFEDLGYAIGHGFEVAMKNHGDDFKRAFEAFGDFFAEMSGPLADFTGIAAGTFADVMPSVTAGMGKITKSMGKFIETFAKFAPDVVTEISDGISGLFEYLARPDVAKACQEITLAFLKLVKEVFAPATIDAILEFTDAVLEILLLVAPLVPLLAELATHVSPIIWVAEAVKQLVQWWHDLQPLIESAWASLQEFWTWLKAKAAEAWQSVKDACNNALEWTKQQWNSFVSWMGAKWTSIKTNAQAAWNSIKTSASDAWNSVKSSASDAWNSIKSSASGAWNSVKSSASGAWASVKSSASGAWNSIKGYASSAWESIKSACSAAVDWIVSKFNSLKDRASGILDSINPANWFSAPLDLDVNLNVGSLPSMTALSVPVGLDSPSAKTLSSLSADNPWKQDVSTLAAGVERANSAFNSSLAIAGMYDPSPSSSSTELGTRRGISVTVNAETNADPVEIGREVAWALRRK